MRNLFNKATGTAIAIAAAALLGSGTANAIHQGEVEHTTVIDEFACFIVPDAYGGDDHGDAFLLTYDSHKLVTPSGNVEYTCFADFDDDVIDGVQGDLPDHAEIVRGFPCTTDAGITTDTHSVTTPRGRVVFKCKITPNSPLPE